ncbi:MAG TPA: hypothetical protein VGH74_18835 [Planctomycetaceae bacterium]|jgi:hypothetical protein
MSCLKLHWPQSLSVYAPVDAEWQDDSAGDDPEGSEPVILSFPRRTRSITGRIGPSIQRDLLTRARIIHENRCCEECGRAAVVPVDAEPALAYRDSMPVPGSGTLIGFACECCGHEWQA